MRPKQTSEPVRHLGQLFNHRAVRQHGAAGIIAQHIGGSLGAWTGASFGGPTHRVASARVGQTLASVATDALRLAVVHSPKFSFMATGALLGAAVTVAGLSVLAPAVGAGALGFAALFVGRWCVGGLRRAQADTGRNLRAVHRLLAGADAPTAGAESAPETASVAPLGRAPSSSSSTAFEDARSSMDSATDYQDARSSISSISSAPEVVVRTRYDALSSKEQQMIARHIEGVRGREWSGDLEVVAVNQLVSNNRCAMIRSTPELPNGFYRVPKGTDETRPHVLEEGHSHFSVLANLRHGYVDPQGHRVVRADRLKTAGAGDCLYHALVVAQQMAERRPSQKNAKGELCAPQDTVRALRETVASDYESRLQSESLGDTADDQNKLFLADSIVSYVKDDAEQKLRARRARLGAS